MNRTHKQNALLVFFCTLSLCLRAGIIFDDPLEMTLAFKGTSSLKPQLVFTPSGQHEDIVLFSKEPEYVIEVEYKDHTSTYKSQQIVILKSKPLTVEIKESFMGIRKVTLKAKSPIQMFRPNKKARLPKNPTREELAAALEPVKGLKIDCSWKRPKYATSIEEHLLENN